MVLELEGGCFEGVAVEEEEEDEIIDPEILLFTAISAAAIKGEFADDKEPDGGLENEPEAPGASANEPNIEGDECET